MPYSNDAYKIPQHLVAKSSDYVKGKCKIQFIYHMKSCNALVSCIEWDIVHNKCWYYYLLYYFSNDMSWGVSRQKGLHYCDKRWKESERTEAHALYQQEYTNDKLQLSTIKNSQTHVGGYSLYTVAT